MIRKITPDDKEYPKNLRNIYDPPKALYVNGGFTGRDDIAVAVVGSRRASAYGLEMAEKFGFQPEGDQVGGRDGGKPCSGRGAVQTGPDEAFDAGNAPLAMKRMLLVEMVSGPP